ncbi:MAG: hypothetical protein KC413_24215, partial [Anaerolineales bacterium]|nr:hypothetical protein [Anaerolineales bacterium]
MTLNIWYIFIIQTFLLSWVTEFANNFWHDLSVMRKTKHYFQVIQEAAQRLAFQQRPRNFHSKTGSKCKSPTPKNGESWPSAA